MSRQALGLVDAKRTRHDPRVGQQQANLYADCLDRQFGQRPLIESVRRRLRDLVILIEKQKRKPIYADFEDVMGVGPGVMLPGFGEGMDYPKFRAKAQVFLRAHQDHLAICKLRMDKALTRSGLAVCSISGRDGP